MITHPTEDLFYSVIDTDAVNPNTLAMTTMLHTVCNSQEEAFNEANRLVNLFMVAAYDAGSCSSSEESEPDRNTLDNLFYTVTDPISPMPDCPVLTVLFYRVCNRDQQKFDKALRLTSLFMEEAYHLGQKSEPVSSWKRLISKVL